VGAPLDLTFEDADWNLRLTIFPASSLIAKGLESSLPKKKRATLSELPKYMWLGNLFVFSIFTYFAETKNGGRPSYISKILNGSNFIICM
jgi:hypothetical protein